MRKILLVVLVYAQVACATPFHSSPAPITSAGDPSAVVPFRWTMQPDGPGGLLLLQGGTLHAIADEVRVLDAGGVVVTSAPTTMLGAGDGGLCGEPQAQGMVAAELRLPDVRNWPDQYRLEAKVGEAWRPVRLTKAC